MPIQQSRLIKKEFIEYKNETLEIHRALLQLLAVGAINGIKFVRADFLRLPFPCSSIGPNSCYFFKTAASALP